ncbi:putative tellurite resistance protein B-like protein [Spirosoma lacussanchae]|uniref:tellurite resistance TerB family protein n=1 Tax=Spirosoma lacussanchae TaxID=1884249 RepID=UPI001FE25339|nr:TerB family tellurite resistance protein [Spirosoma lacussanchae]
MQSLPTLPADGSAPIQEITETITHNDRLATLYLGLGNAVYALTKVDGRIQREESDTVQQILASLPQGHLALQAFSVLDSCDVPVEAAYAFAMRRFSDNRKALNEALKKQFVSLLLQVAEAHDSLSTKEQEFIKRFRRDLRRF